jgi:ABC-type uncharacterized transport system permease subunit
MSILVLFLGTISYMIFTNLFMSFSFYFKKIKILYILFFKKIIYLNEKFTPKSFESSPFRNFFYLLPSAFYSYFVIEVLNGRFSVLLYYLPYFLLLNLILFLIFIFVWKQGLKRYEAYG